jgi:hypothetical protein
MGLSSDNPRLASQTNVCGETHVVDEDGNIIKRATARNDRMRFFNFRGGQTVDPQGGVIDAYSGSTFTACKPWMATWATLRKTSSASATSTPVARPGRHELESG